MQRHGILYVEVVRACEKYTHVGYDDVKVHSRGGNRGCIEKLGRWRHKLPKRMFLGTEGLVWQGRGTDGYWTLNMM